MHVTIGQATLARALALVAPVAADGPAGLRLDHLLVRAEGSLLEVVATDLTDALRLRLPAVVWAAGAVTAPARLLHNLIAGLPGGDVALMVDDHHQLAIRSGRIGSTLAGHDPDDFPVLPASDGWPPIAHLWMGAGCKR